MLPVFCSSTNAAGDELLLSTAARMLAERYRVMIDLVSRVLKVGKLPPRVAKARPFRCPIRHEAGNGAIGRRAEARRMREPVRSCAAGRP
jgi:hypothetical protein